MATPFTLIMQDSTSQQHGLVATLLQVAILVENPWAPNQLTGAAAWGWLADNAEYRGSTEVLNFQ